MHQNRICMFIAAVLWAAFLMVAKVSANQPPFCMPYSSLIAQITTGEWQEVKIAEATAGDQEVHVYLSERGTYTIFYRSPHAPAFACFLVAGRDWQFVKFKPPGSKS